MKRFLKGFGLALLLAVIGVASALGVIALLLRQDEVRVPGLAGQDIVAALDAANQAGLQLKVDRREPNPALPKDTIISQTPAPGEGLKKGRQIRVVVSLGPSELLAPKVAGENIRKAEVLIRQAGFVPGDTARVPSRRVERDTVIAQSPEEGTSLEKGGGIDLLVSAGKEPSVFAMPRLTGKTPGAAIRTVEAMGLLHRISYRSAAGTAQQPERLVVGQKPLPGYPVTAEATVELIVSK